ncbi:aryl-sulfate sulfotransferase [Listeria ivanovii]|uniref:aryl-sulfate sulfotransferase n=1 Tax=Listeria ivanovii TaxID=1638 RepID=UPI0003EC8AB8|nr:aryl-sulfate sulfotransferase [Listeria ivanovii]AHI56484.1 arylsulfate sulfotransferase [Listeria ivanovii WSLC3009]AIS65906.1 arylsulfate sulfotransferase [Listeria ivanovii subsp. ivanovii]MBC1759057.1 aryl-sulfate sulfotransferase [Listeria ivanovii]MBK3914081.1 aryl-sulfate sulfotransferase [Listeria ivanovii subsp. ivanovii]MBK3921081.1 aryl-sulfate sulfotransferase [Listeria ivanovii subsp. ivanovii]
MKKTQKPKKMFLLLLTSLVIILAVGIGYYFYQDKTEASEQDYYMMDTDLVDEQTKIEKQLKESSASSTLENPNIKLNPYGTSPLTALLLFDTDEKMKITVEVEGENTDTTIQSEVNADYTTHHEVAVLGLYADKANKVKIIAVTQDGKKIEKTVTIQTDKLPAEMPEIEVASSDTTQMEQTGNQLTFITPSTKYAYGVDSNGDVRWYSTKYNSHVFKELENGHLLYLTKYDNTDDTYSLLLETDYLGKIYHAYSMTTEAESEQSGSSSKSAIHHDAIELPSGNLLLTINDDTKYMEDTMIEIDRQTGKVVKTIDLKDILPEEFYQDYKARSDGKVDWFHQNAIWYDESDDSIVISSRSQDTIMKLDYDTTKIKWILSDKEGWPDSYKKYLLDSTGTNFKYPAGQHAVEILPDQDDNPDTVDILLYDNNVVVTRGDEDVSGEYSEALQYRINEKTKKVEIVFSYGKALGEDYWTEIVGGSRYMENTGNYLINFGHRKNGKESSILEVNQEGQIVFEMHLMNFPDSAWAYRAERFSLYPASYSFKMTQDE